MIDAVLTTWNLNRITQGCIKSFLKTQTLPTRLIAVDNNSNDGLERYLAELNMKGEIELYTHRNISMAESVNIGLLKARSDYVAYLTNDLVFKQKGWLERLVWTMASDENIGLVGCKILFMNGRVMHGGVGFWDWDGSGFNHWRHFGYDKKDDGSWNGVREVPAICVAACLMRRKAFFDVGGFNPAYVGSGVCVDTEFCIELRKKGWRIMYDGSCVVYHHNRSSDVLRSKQEQSEHERANMAYCYGKYQKWIDEDKMRHPELYDGVI